MITFTAIGFSQAFEVRDAAYQAATSVKHQLGTDHADLVMVFACGAYACPESLTVINALLQPRRLIGTSTSNIILTDGAFNKGLVVLAITSTQMNFGIASGKIENTTASIEGFDWARRITADLLPHQHQACLIFADPYLQNNISFIRAAQEVLGTSFPVIGGLSSIVHAPSHPIPPCQFYKDQILTDGVVGLLISGANIHISSKHGFKPLGKPRTITKSRGNVIQMIDGLPAMNIYKEFLGPEVDMIKNRSGAAHSILYPLGIYLEDLGQYLLKNAVDILEDGSIVCQGEVPEGSEVHLMIGNRGSFKNSALDAAAQVKNALGEREAKLILIIESSARHKILKNSVAAQIQALKDVLGYKIPLVGLCSMGEIVPLVPGQEIKNIQIQNESIMILAIN